MPLTLKANLPLWMRAPWLLLDLTCWIMAFPTLVPAGLAWTVHPCIPLLEASAMTSRSWRIPSPSRYGPDCTFPGSFPWNSKTLCPNETFFSSPAWLVLLQTFPKPHCVSAIKVSSAAPRTKPMHRRRPPACGSHVWPEAPFPYATSRLCFIYIEERQRMGKAALFHHGPGFHFNVGSAEAGKADVFICFCSSTSPTSPHPTPRAKQPEFICL